MGKAKITFAAIPARAYGDPRLKGLHHKTLGVVALHDRMSSVLKKGQGCWAGNKRLAELIGCNYSRLSATLSDLATWGYIDSRTDPMNKTRRILFVVYDDRDGAFLKANHDENPLPTGKQSAADDGDDDDEDSLPTGKQSAADDSLPTGEDGADIVCLDFQTSHKYQSLGGGEYIPQKRGRDSAEAGNRDSAEAGIDSAEAATPCGDAKDLLGKEESEPDRSTTTGNLLGRIQTWLKSLEGERLTEGQIDELHEKRKFCDEVEEQHGLDGVGPWAQRLAIDIGILLDEPDDEDDEPFCPEDRAVSERAFTTTETTGDGEFVGEPRKFTTISGGRS